MTKKKKSMARVLNRLNLVSRLLKTTAVQQRWNKTQPAIRYPGLATGLCYIKPKDDIS